MLASPANQSRGPATPLQNPTAISGNILLFSSVDTSLTVGRRPNERKTKKRLRISLMHKRDNGENVPPRIFANPLKVEPPMMEIDKAVHPIAVALSEGRCHSKKGQVERSAGMNCCVFFHRYFNINTLFPQMPEHGSFRATGAIPSRF